MDSPGGRLVYTNSKQHHYCLLDSPGCKCDLLHGCNHYIKYYKIWLSHKLNCAFVSPTLKGN